MTFGFPSLRAPFVNSSDLTITRWWYRLLVQMANAIRAIGATSNGVTAVANNTATTLFPYIANTRMMCKVSLGDGIGGGTFDVLTNGGTVMVANGYYSGDGMVVSVSGSNIQLTQTSGGPLTATWSYLAI